MKIASVIGHFAKKKQDSGGQTIKTRTVTEEIKKQFGQEQVLEFDTCGGFKSLIKAPFQVISALKKSRSVIIFPAHRALRVYSPLLSFFKHFFKGRKLHYVVIGGWLPEFVSKRKRLAKTLKKFEGIYVETNTMKKALEAQGFENIYLMPNCKKLTVISEDELVCPEGTPYKLCTFSRVSKEKGIEDAVKAVRSVNDSLGFKAFTLDIYGQVDYEQVEWFNELQSTFPEYIKYKGCVAFDKSVEVLKNYFALLFPTYYEGEGFAGTLIDAFSAGIPVIASDWKYNPEIVNECVGYVYPAKDCAALTAVLKSVLENPNVILEKKAACLVESRKYDIKAAVRELLGHL